MKEETMQRLTRDALRDVPFPDDLDGKILAGLDAVDAERGESVPLWRCAGAAAAVLAGLMAVALFSTDRQPLHVAVAHDVHEHVEGRLPLALETERPAELERFFAAQGIRFETRVFDLGMMQVKLLGGMVHRFDNGPSAAFSYETAEALRILCQMYEGRIEDLPPTDDVREHNGIRFYSYQTGCVSMTFWREGNVICVLASMGDLEDVVALAFAKAVKV